MVRYGYNAQFTPPAPLVHVTVRSPDLTKEVPDFPAQLDTAADRSVLPQQIADDLALPQAGQIALVGLGGHLTTTPLFLVQLEVRQLSPLLVVVAASTAEPLILLGRDVLNQFKILLDGPGLALEMG